MKRFARLAISSAACQAKQISADGEELARGGGDAGEGESPGNSFSNNSGDFTRYLPRERSPPPGSIRTREANSPRFAFVRRGLALESTITRVAVTKVPFFSSLAASSR